MNTDNIIDDETLQRAIDKWGKEAQIDMIEEECLELALAIQKLKRKRGIVVDKVFNICDEIADCKIMLRQAEKIFDKQLIDERVRFKMNRLKDRLLFDNAG